MYDSGVTPSNLSTIEAFETAIESIRELIDAVARFRASIHRSSVTVIPLQKPSKGRSNSKWDNTPCSRAVLLVPITEEWGAEIRGYIAQMEVCLSAQFQELRCASAQGLPDLRKTAFECAVAAVEIGAFALTRLHLPQPDWNSEDYGVYSAKENHARMQVTNLVNDLARVWTQEFAVGIHLQTQAGVSGKRAVKRRRTPKELGTNDKAAQLWPSFVRNQKGRATVGAFIEWLRREHKIVVSNNAETAIETMKTCLGKHYKRATRKPKTANLDGLDGQ